MLPDGPLCGCGKRGCLEALSSGPAIARTAVEALKSGAESLLRPVFVERPLCAQDLVEAARRGDALSCQILEQAGNWLGRGLAYYVDINNPEFIIIGGGMQKKTGQLGLADGLVSSPEGVLDKAHAYAREAKELVQGFPDGPERDALQAIPDYVVERDR